jgi:hypothetical protein
MLGMGFQSVDCGLEEGVKIVGRRGMRVNQT